MVPQAVYTYVAPDHPGTSYRAAGWRCVGRTSGRPPGGAPVEPKAVWVKPLVADWRNTLCQEPAHVLGATPTPFWPKGSDWADMEYRRSSYPDRRVRKRLVIMGRAWEQHPGAPLPVMFPAEAEQKAAYRLLSNDRIQMKHILEPHQEATVERCRQSQVPVILALQDTTTLNYHGHRKTTGLVPIGGRGSGAMGLLAHVGLCITEARRPLGVFELNATQRDPQPKGQEAQPESIRWRQGLERAGELEAACADSRVVTVCDREGDIWDLFTDAQSRGDALLVRSDRGRKRQVMTADGPQGLWDFMAAQPVLGKQTLTIAACGGPRRRRARKARLDLRSARVDLIPPMNRTDTTPLSMLAVSVSEPRRPRARSRYTGCCWPPKEMPPWTRRNALFSGMKRGGPLRNTSRFSRSVPGWRTVDRMTLRIFASVSRSMPLPPGG